jgi:hypothetical protein
MSRYWYFTEIHWCPVCGREKRYRERRHDAKPPRQKDRIKHVQMYDGCEGLY